MWIMTKAPPIKSYLTNKDWGYFINGMGSDQYFFQRAAPHTARYFDLRYTKLLIVRRAIVNRSTDPTRPAVSQSRFVRYQGIS